jgi:hypothetical protein
LKMPIAWLSLLTICCLGVTPALADSILYSNGPTNGTTDAWNVAQGFSVSDSFTVPANSVLLAWKWVHWSAPGGGHLVTTDMAFGSTSFGGTFHTYSETSTFLGTNQFGYELWEDSATIPGIPWSGAGWVTLENACTTDGCGVDPVYWDENSGPSSAFENVVGSIPSESFTLIGTTETTTPEPSAIMLFGSGILGVAGFLRRRLF